MKVLDHLKHALDLNERRLPNGVKAELEATIKHLEADGHHYEVVN